MKYLQHFNIMEDVMTFWQKFISLPPIMMGWFCMGLIFMPLIALQQWSENVGLLIGGPIMALNVWHTAFNTLPRYGTHKQYWPFLGLMLVGCGAFYFSKNSVVFMGYMFVLIVLMLLDAFGVWFDSNKKAAG